MPTRRASSRERGSRPGQHQRRGGVLHRMQIEQVVGGVDDRAQRAGPFELDRAARAVERRRAPQPVEVLVDIARGDRVARVELAIGRDIVEGQRQPAAPRPDPGAKQPVERDRAANLVAVGQRAHQHMRPRLGGVEAGDVFDTGVARPIRFDIGRRQLHPVGEVGQGTILRTTAMAPIVHGLCRRVTRRAACLSAKQPQRLGLTRPGSVMEVGPCVWFGR